MDSGARGGTGLSKQPAPFSVVWHAGIPVGIGYVSAALVWACVPQGTRSLAWLVSGGGATSGLLLGLLLYWATRTRTVYWPVGCLASAAAPIAALLLGAWAARAALALPFPDWAVAWLIGAAIGAPPVVLLQLGTSHSESSVVWRAIVLAGVAAVLLVGAPLLAPHGHATGQARCLSNLKQLATPMQMYVEDHAGRFPPPGPFSDSVRLDAPSGGEGTYGSGWLVAYTRDTRFWVCPSDPNAHDHLDRPRPEFLAETGTSFHWNADLAGRKLGELEAPEDVTAIFDRGPFNNDGRNVSFADGHVKWIEESDFQDLGVVGR